MVTLMFKKTFACTKCKHNIVEDVEQEEKLRLSGNCMEHTYLSNGVIADGGCETAVTTTR